MRAVPALIQRHKAEILDRIDREVMRSASLRGLTGPEFRPLARQLLDSLADDRRPSRLFAVRAGEWLRHLRDGADLREAMEVLAIVRRVVVRVGRSHDERHEASAGDWERLTRSVERTMAQISELFQRSSTSAREADSVIVAHLERIATLANEAGPLRSKDLAHELRPILQHMRSGCDATGIALVVRERAGRAVVVRVTDGAAAADALAVAEGDGASVRQRVTAWPVPERGPLGGVLGVVPSHAAPLEESERQRLLDLAERVVTTLDRAWLSRELRHRNDQLAAEREFGERFTAILAHDLRGPLATARLGAQLLERLGDDRERQEVVVARILRNIDRMDGMLRDCLDVSRVRAGQRLPLKVAPCDLEVLAREVIDDLAQHYGDRFTLSSSGPLVGYWSVTELRRAVWNLGANAARYGAAREPIAIELNGEANAVTIRVHNRGNPIATVDQALLFDGYFRAGSSAAEGDGWGLGLAQVRACAEAHGGRAEVTSSPSAGTTFVIHLPVDARSTAGRETEPDAAQRSS